MIGVFAVVGIEFLSILPGECVMNDKDMSHFISVKLFFFSCNVFRYTDPVVGVSVFHWENQIIELICAASYFSWLAQ